MGPISRRDRLAAAAVGLLGGLALLQHWLDDRRPPAAENRVASEIVVSSAEDRGEGSLREAIFAADSAEGRVRIALRTPRIRLRSPLPPLANPHGILLQGDANGTELDLSGVGPAAAIEVRGDHTEIAGVSFTGAPGQAIQVAARGFRLTGGLIAACDEGVRTTEGAQAMTIENMRFQGNGSGIRIDMARADMVIRDNQFAGHKEAAVWVVQAADARADPAAAVTIVSNRFKGDRLSVVAANAPVTVEKNEFLGNREAAMLVLGSGARVRENQVRDGEGIGVIVQGASRTLVEANEISRNRALGVLVRASGGATVRGNRLYGNGYGMAFVLGDSSNPVTVSDNAVLNQRYDGIVVIGDSPVVQRNRTLHNGAAGVRVLDVSSRSAATVLAVPFLEGNTMAGNLLNEVVRGDYRVDNEKGAR
jgi:parallel beta-helix repeat protein